MKTPFVLAAFVFAFSVLEPLSHIAAEDVKETPSPGKTTSAFFEAIRAGSAETAGKLAVDWKEIGAQESIAEMVKKAKAQPAATPVKILDEKALGDVAIVIVGNEGRRYRTGIDLDPVFLTRRDGTWCVVPAQVPPAALRAMVAASTDKEETQKQLMQLGQWFAERKEAIYKEREKDAAKPE